MFFEKNVLSEVGKKMGSFFDHFLKKVIGRRMLFEKFFKFLCLSKKPKNDQIWVILMIFGKWSKIPFRIEAKNFRFLAKFSEKFQIVSKREKLSKK